MVPDRSKGLAWMALVFAVALAVRLWHVADIRPSPFFDVLVGDARAYDAWAQRIAAGDWFGQDVFYQAPLYPYFLGTLYALAGRDLLIVRLVQVTLGALACVFLAVAAARLFGRRVGIGAGLLLALYAPAVFFDALIQKTVLDGILICLALVVISGLIVGPPSPWRWWWLGSVLGLLALTRENAMVLVAVVACWSIARDDVQTAARLRDRVRLGTAPFLLGLAVVLLPVAARNYAVGGGFFVTTSQFGTNFYLGNNPHTDGTAGSLVAGRGAAEYEQRDAIELAERATGRSLSPGEVSAFWTDRALSFITSQPWAWMRLMSRKALLLVNKTEMLDTESQESYAEWSTPLRIGSIVGHFGVLVPLAAIGLIWTWPDRRRLWVLYALATAYAASVVLFFIYARYRFPLVPILLLFASVGLLAAGTPVLAALRQLFLTGAGAPPPARSYADASPRIKNGSSARHGRGRSRKTASILIAAVIVLVTLCNWPLLSASRMRAITEHNYGAALQSDGRLDDAVRHYERAVAVDPTYAPAYSNMGAALLAKGRSDGAKRAYQEALQIDPDFADAHFNLGNALLREGNPAGAIEHFEHARRTMPGVSDVHHNLGVAFAEAGRIDEAAAAFERALALSPASTETLTALADLEASRNRGAAALDYLRRAVQLRPEDASAHYNLARQLLENDRPAEAIPEFETAVRLAPNHAQTRNDFGIALATLGRPDAAREQFQEALRLSPGFEAAARNLSALRASNAAR